MKYVISCLAIAVVCLFHTHSVYAEESCECPKLACDPCSFERGVTFYSQKCGPEDSKVKSCGRPTCIPIDTATKECPVPPKADSGPREPIVVGQSPAVPQESGEEKIAVESIGKVKVIQGSVAIKDASGTRTITQTGDLHEGETIETSSDGGAVVDFKGGNKLDVHPDTTVKVEEYKNQNVEASRRALLNLIKGRIRNQVDQKYNGKTSYYKVKTKSAVAGVRGTVFVVDENEAETETKVSTLRGKVILSSLDEKQSEAVERGESATLSDGKLAPVIHMNEEEIKELERSSQFLARRKSHGKVSDQPICESPKGLLNQCQWRCENNPAHEGRCRVDLPKVTCVRQRCNANGVWSEKTSLPEGAEGTACPASGVLVKTCDY